MTEQILLDPTAESAPVQRPRIDRPEVIKGKTVGLLDISKPRGNELLDRLEALMTAEGLKVKRYRKHAFSQVAKPELKQQIGAECDLAVEALAD